MSACNCETIDGVGKAHTKECVFRTVTDWSVRRNQLAETVAKYPVLLMDALDSAYLAGLDAGSDEEKENLEMHLKEQETHSDYISLRKLRTLLRR